MTHEATKTLFSEWAASGRADRMESSHGDVAEQVIASMGIQPGMQALDLGCGTGWATRLLGKAAPGATAVGIDFSAAMIQRAEEMHDLTSRARYLQAPLDNIDFKDGRFDRIFSMEALPYVGDLEAALREAWRLTKPKGEAYFIIGRYKECAPSKTWADTIGLPMAWLAESEWRTALEDAGFCEVASDRIRDSRGPGEESAFTPDEYTADWATHQAIHEAGYLLLRGQHKA